MFLDLIKKEELHHSYIIESDEDNDIEKVKIFLSEFDGNNEIQIKEVGSFTVDDARELKKASRLKKGEGIDRKFFIIKTDFFTNEAQNALLKTFEEPTEGTHFFIITPKSGGLLPTLLSRFFVIKKEEIFDTKEAEEFLSATEGERLNHVKKIISGNKEHGEMKAVALLLINSIEHALKKSNEYKKYEKIEDLFLCKKLIQQRGSSVKMILEYLCVVI